MLEYQVRANNELSRKLIAARRKLGLNKIVVAARLQISEAQLQKIEVEPIKIPLTQLRQIFQIYQFDERRALRILELGRLILDRE